MCVCVCACVCVCQLQFPTFRAYPLQPECDTWCEFPVKDRPNAVVQFLMAAEQHPELIQGAWLLMLESDYVWMRPLKVGGCQQERWRCGSRWHSSELAPAPCNATRRA